jgi:hypothetical protein
MPCAVNRSIVAATMLLAAGACGGPPSTQSSSAAPGDAVTVRVDNRTADPVIFWYVYETGPRHRFAEVDAGRTQTVAIPFQAGATRISFEARGSSRTRGQDRVSNSLPIEAGVRLILVVEGGTLFARNLDERVR